VLLDTNYNEVIGGPVVRQGNVLQFTPPLGYPLGITTFILRGYLASYPLNPPLDVPFDVEVLACRTTIDPTNVTVQNKFITWSDPALPYGIGNIFGQYRQVPDCQYPLEYEILYEDMTNSPGVQSLANPPEITYNPQTKTFNIEKCSDAQALADPTNSYDPECGNVPYGKVFRITIKVTLPAEPTQAFNNQVSFEVIIGNVCEDDTISFIEPIQDVTYTIMSFNPYLFTDRPTIVQNEVICPVTCQLLTQDGLEVPSGWGISFNPNTVEFGLQTSNKALHGTFIDLKIVCVAVDSTSGPGGSPDIAVNEFRVTFRDECFDSVIQPAVGTSKITYLWQYFAWGYTPSDQSLQ